MIHYLIHRMSFSSLGDLHSGAKFMGRSVSPSILFPYATYSGRQMIAHLPVAWRTCATYAPRLEWAQDTAPPAT